MHKGSAGREAPKQLPEKEFSVIQEIARKPSQTQRELSQSLGLSLGMTNILLKRLARKGYIKVRLLDWKRSQYLLTLKGALEKTSKSCAYVLHTIRQFRLIRDNISVLLLAEYGQGMRSAVIVAWPETAEMIRGVVDELGLEGLELRYVETYGGLNGASGTVFTATVEPAPPALAKRLIPLLEPDDLKFRFEG